MYITKEIESQIRLMAKHSPSVAILGSRQVDKTTLAKLFSAQFDKESVYLDIKNPAVDAVLGYPVEFIHAVQNKTVIIDEIQRRPDLFPVLRSAIDLNCINGRFAAI